MKKIIFLITIIGLTTLGFGYKSDYKLITDSEIQYRYLLETPKTMGQQNFIKWLEKNNFDIAGVNLHENTVEVITTDAGLNLLKKNNLLGFIRSLESSSRSLPPDPQYFNPTTLEQKLIKINQDYPDITKLEKIGTTLQGRPIWALLVSANFQNKKAFQNNPSIIIDGMHHAREIMTPEVVVGLAQNTIQALLNTSDEFHSLSRSWNFWFIPMLNVDGNNIVWTKNNWWRKNARSNGNTIHGVDINRNYTYKWGQCNGSSGSLNSDTYRGASPGSENETDALNNLAKKIKPTAYVSYHSYGELILFPFGCTGKKTAEHELYTKVGQELKNLLPSDSSGSTYTSGTPWEVLYGVDGDSMSHMHSQYGSFAITYEINSSFQPSYSLKAPTIIKHFNAFKYLINRMTTNLLKLSIQNKNTTESLTAEVSIQSVKHQNDERPFSTNENGVFYKVLDPGSYEIKLKTNTGTEKNIQINMNGTQEVIVEI